MGKSAYKQVLEALGINDLNDIRMVKNISVPGYRIGARVMLLPKLRDAINGYYLGKSPKITFLETKEQYLNLLSERRSVFLAAILGDLAAERNVDMIMDVIKENNVVVIKESTSEKNLDDSDNDDVDIVDPKSREVKPEIIDISSVDDTSKGNKENLKDKEIIDKLFDGISKVDIDIDLTIGAYSYTPKAFQKVVIPYLEDIKPKAIQEDIQDFDENSAVIKYFPVNNRTLVVEMLNKMPVSNAIALCSQYKYDIDFDIHSEDVSRRIKTVLIEGILNDNRYKVNKSKNIIQIFTSMCDDKPITLAWTLLNNLYHNLQVDETVRFIRKTKPTYISERLGRPFSNVWSKVDIVVRGLMKENSYSSDDVSKLQQQNELLKEKVNQINTLYEEAREELHKLANLNENFAKEVKKEVAEFKDKGISNAIESAKEGIKSLAVGIREEATQNDDAEKRIEQLQQDKEKLQHDKEELQLDKAKIVQICEEGKVKIEGLKGDIQKAEAEIGDLKKKLDEKGLRVELIKYKDEKGLIETLKNNAAAMKLYYSDDDLLNFHMSLKTSNLTILEGMSGTGKSKLISLYANTLGLKNGEQLKLIPVSPSWTDDTDILGYLDPTTMTYKEASIGLVSFLKRAAENEDKQYIVCFDEMNLAKVEYYFAQFISVLENDDNNRFLQIYSDVVSNEVVNHEDYPARIKIGRNVMFCGTINVDESTYRLSDKVLDRANLMRLAKPSISKIKELEKTKATLRVYNGGISFDDKPIPLNDDEISLLNKLDEVLCKSNSRYGIAYRTTLGIQKYIGTLPEKNDIIKRRKAMDMLIVEKILPKIRGTLEQIGELMGNITLDGVYEPGLIDKAINDGVVRYSATREALKSKVRELKLYGYIS